jgi:hypothetical protein
MKVIDSKAWAAAYKSEYIGLNELGVFKVVWQQPGTKILHSLTTLEYRRIW